MTEEIKVDNMQQFNQYNHNVQQQEIYLKLTNYRKDVMQDDEHKLDVLKGYYKTLLVLSRFKK